MDTRKPIGISPGNLYASETFQIMAERKNRVNAERAGIIATDVTIDSIAGTILGSEQETEHVDSKAASDG
jgi:hypothetical protein